MAKGFDIKTLHFEYNFHEHLAIHDTKSETIKAETEGYDAVVIGCFYDPRLWEARERVEMPVEGIYEARLH